MGTWVDDFPASEHFHTVIESKSGQVDAKLYAEVYIPTNAPLNEVIVGGGHPERAPLEADSPTGFAVSWHVAYATENPGRPRIHYFGAIPIGGVWIPAPNLGVLPGLDSIFEEEQIAQAGTAVERAQIANDSLERVDGGPSEIGGFGQDFGEFANPGQEAPGGVGRADIARQLEEENLRQ